MPVIMQITMLSAMTTQNPHGLPSKGTPVFIPQKDAIIDGMAIKMVITVNVFITMLRLFDIIDA